jgi:hypothetical protein
MRTANVISELLAQARRRSSGQDQAMRRREGDPDRELKRALRGFDEPFAADSGRRQDESLAVPSGVAFPFALEKPNVEILCDVGEVSAPDDQALQVISIERSFGVRKEERIPDPAESEIPKGLCETSDEPEDTIADEGGSIDDSSPRDGLRMSDPAGSQRRSELVLRLAKPRDFQILDRGG